MQQTSTGVGFPLALQSAMVRLGVNHAHQASWHGKRSHHAECSLCDVRCVLRVSRVNNADRHGWRRIEPAKT